MTELVKARVLADSISDEGVRLTSFEIEYPRLILSELNTHQMLAKNSASSRAIPFAKMQEQLTAKPVRFGSANKGMQDGGMHEKLIQLETLEDFDDPSDSGLFQTSVQGYTPEQAWNIAKEAAVGFSKSFHKAGYHKQIYNRLTEPFQMMKTVISGTEWANFFWLRDDDAADPTIAALARAMKKAMNESTPQVLQAGEWHLTYVDTKRDEHGNLRYGDFSETGEFTEYNLLDAIKVSAARTAAVSFRNLDYTLEKCLEVYDRLVGDDKKHASAFGHQCTPILHTVMNAYDDHINIPTIPSTWQDGISHSDRNGQLWSAMMRGYIQYRKLIPGENFTGSKEQQ